MGTTYKCAKCGTEIKEGQFIAIIGKAPASGLSAPIGRVDKLFKDIGHTYCANCTQSIGAENLVHRARQSDGG